MIFASSALTSASRCTRERDRTRHPVATQPTVSPSCHRVGRSSTCPFLSNLPLQSGMSNNQAGAPFRLSATSNNQSNPFSVSRVRASDATRQNSPFSRFPNHSNATAAISASSRPSNGHSTYRTSDFSNAYMQTEVKPVILHSSQNDPSWTTAVDHIDGNPSNHGVRSHARSTNIAEMNSQYISALHPHQAPGRVSSEASYAGDSDRYALHGSHASNTRSTHIRGSTSENNSFPVEHDMSESVVKMEDSDGAVDLSSESMMMKCVVDMRNARQALEEQVRRVSCEYWT